jgi:beta-glucosidase
MLRIDALLRSMTLEEKLGQLNLATAHQAVTGPETGAEIDALTWAGRLGGVFNLWGRAAVMTAQRRAVEETRLGIPLFFGLDVLHGHRTIFPIPLAEAGSFDPELWTRTARAAAREAAADGVMLTFAPMLDVARDPRWGRIAEGPGEDPCVATAFAIAKIRGFQGDSLAASGALAATAKHFCAGGAANAGLDYAAVDISERLLHEVYLPPFRAAIEAGCAAIMPAFNSVAGVPMTAHATLLTGYLREKIGFDGVILSDYTAIPELVVHGVAADPVEAAALALNAGVDIDMASGVYLRHLPEALAQGQVAEATIDAAVRRVLKLKERLGLFDDPYRIAPIDATTEVAHRELARESARRSITLLVNDGVLPLARGLRRIAVIGPLADSQVDMLGPWSAAGRAEDCVTLLQGLRDALPDTRIAFARGVGFEESHGDAAAIDEVRQCVRDSDLVVLCLGEAARMSGEATSRARPGLPAAQHRLAEVILDTGASVALVLFGGRPLVLGALATRVRAILAAWFPGTMAGPALADILTGAVTPVARLPVTWPRAVGQIPIFHAQRSSGRPPAVADPFTSKYLDLPVTPLFPFGHGLSYGRVTLAALRADQDHFGPAARIEVLIDAINDGDIPLNETIFLFLHDTVASVARPLLELKCWRRVLLPARSAQTIAFSLTDADFAFPGVDMNPMTEPGAFEIFVGGAADPERLHRIVLYRDAAHAECRANVVKPG